MTLDQAMQKFAAYARGEGDFDELDFKRVIEQRVAHELHELIAKNTDTMLGTTNADGVFEDLCERIGTLTNQTKGHNK